MKDKGIKIPVIDGDETDIDTQNEESQGIEANQKENEYMQHLQRLKAEFDNYRKRTENERINHFKLAKGELVSNLMPVIDDLERMVQFHEEDGQCSVEGIKLIFQKMMKVLEDEGLETIQSKGKTFDPEWHEAVSVKETSKKEEENLNLEEWQKGYSFDGRLLRPSKVKVGKYIDNEE